MEYSSTACKYSACKHYRYLLSRSWQQGAGRVVFIGLNPSTADAVNDDPTIKRCVDYAARWGFAHMDMVNLFSFRATQPELLMAAKNPVGPCNDSWLDKSIARSDLAIACWGNHGSYLNRSSLINDRYPQLLCLKTTARSQPAHPLYLSAALLPRPY